MNNTSPHLLIGSSSECDIVIDRDTVSRRHCQLLWLGNSWEIRDLESTNGTFINGRRIAQPTLLAGDEKVTLGRGIDLQLPPPLQPSQKTHSRAAGNTSPQTNPPACTLDRAKEFGPDNSSSRISPGLVYTIIFGCGASLLVLAILLFTNSSFISHPEENIDDAGIASPNEALSPEANPEVAQGRNLAAAKLSGDTHTGKRETNSAENPNAPPKRSDQKTVAQITRTEALWAVVVENTHTHQRLLLGTAIAIEPKRLLTLASIVDAAQNVEDQYPVIKLHSPVEDAQPLSVSSKGIHPDYEQAVSELERFREELQAKLDSISEQDAPELDEQLEWSGRLDTIMEKIDSFDVAYLQVENPLSAIVKIATPDDKKESTTCILDGFPTLESVPRIDDGVDNFRVTLQGRISTRSRSTHASKTSSRDVLRRVEFDDGLLFTPTSLGCFDRQGNLLGLCGTGEPPSVSSDRSGRVSFIDCSMFW